MFSADPLTRFSRACGIATLSPKRARVIVKTYAGQETSCAHGNSYARRHAAQQLDNHRFILQDGCTLLRVANPIL
jgi:hypothetical protein